MEDIKIIEKPDWITWQQVQDCITIAQKTNNKKGFDMLFGHNSAEQLEKAIGDGYCYVALNADNKVVGTVSLIISNINYWWHKGKAGLQGYEGILPEYRGSDVYFDLHDKIDEKQKELGIGVIWASTAEKNKVVIKACKLQGWKIVQYSPTGKGATYYSYIFARWLNGCPFSEKRISFMFKLSKIVVKALYKPGKILRIYFWK